MGERDCFVCEADIYVSDPSIFDAELSKPCYYGKMVQGYSEDWLFDQDENGRITRVGKYGEDKYNMCGVCCLNCQCENRPRRNGGSLPTPWQSCRLWICRI